MRTGEPLADVGELLGRGVGLLRLDRRFSSASSALGARSPSGGGGRRKAGLFGSDRRSKVSPLFSRVSAMAEAMICINYILIVTAFGLGERQKSLGLKYCSRKTVGSAPTIRAHTCDLCRSCSARPLSAVRVPAYAARVQSLIFACSLHRHLGPESFLPQGPS